MQPQQSAKRKNDLKERSLKWLVVIRKQCGQNKWSDYWKLKCVCVQLEHITIFARVFIIIAGFYWPSYYGNIVLAKDVNHSEIIVYGMSEWMCVQIFERKIHIKV